MKTLAIGLAVAALLLPSTGWGRQGVFRAEPRFQPLSAEAKSHAPKRLATKASRIVLPALKSVSSALAEGEGALLVGFPRALPAIETESRLQGRLDWQELADGRRVAAVSVTSHGAAAVRLGVYVSALPPLARLRFAAASGGEVFEFSGEEVLDLIANNLEAGGSGVEARTFWSPVIESATAVMEVELPAGVPVEHLRIGVPRLSHFLGTAANEFGAAKSSACHIDVSCHSSSWGRHSNAVARMIFTVNGASYICTGTLIADQDPMSHVPYFHTAQHCIPDQTTASSIVTYWFYRSAGCNSTNRAKHEVRTGGAVLLHVDRESDVAFMRLNAAPPAGALFAGWIAGAPLRTGTSVTGIHHPTGELQKISFGQIDSYVSCLSPNGDNILCSHAFVPDAKFYSVSWSGGVTEAGSSGSGLFIDEGKYLIGQLFGGSSSCEAKSRGDYYARFDITYRSALHKWLGTRSTTAEATAAPLRLRMTFALERGRAR